MNQRILVSHALWKTWPSNPRVTLYTAGHLHTALPYCSHSRAPIVHTAVPVPRENNEHGCVYLRCRDVCKLPGCVEGHPWNLGKSKSKSKKTLFNVGQCKQYNISSHLKWVLGNDKNLGLRPDRNLNARKKIRHLFLSIRVDSRFARSQWETSLQGNAVVHWLGANLETALSIYQQIYPAENANMELVRWIPVFLCSGEILHVWDVSCPTSNNSIVNKIWMSYHCRCVSRSHKVPSTGLRGGYYINQ